MVALAGAFAFIVPYGPQAAPDTVITARPEILRIARELDFEPIHSPNRPYEIAAAIAQALSNVELALDDLDGDTVGPAAEVHARMATRSLGIARAYVVNRGSLRELAKAFQSELKELGADERWIATKMDRFDLRIGSSRIHRHLETDAATLKRTEPEIQRLLKAFNMRPFRSQFPRPMSTWETAVALNAMVSMAQNATKDFDREAARLAWDGWGTTVETRTASVQRNLEIARTMRTHRETVARLVNTFAYELGQLGVDVPGVRQSIRRTAGRAPYLHIPKPGEAYAPFPDVPQDHWAAKSIQALRMAGIVRGHPDGTFRGN